MDLLKNLLNAYGVSGHEGNVRKIIEKAIRPYVDEMRVDKMGNLICHKRGRGKRIMLASHMDEIGLMVKDITDRGIITCSEVGGIQAITLIGEMVQITTNKAKIHGIITTREVSAADDVEEVPDISDLIIDTGLTFDELIAKGVTIGTYVDLERQGNYFKYGKKITGKAVDDRIGCFILIELAKQLKTTETDLYFVFTVQEEVGLFGAKVSAFQIMPDWGIAVDTTYANDLNHNQGDGPIISMGKGPVITVMDAGFISNRTIDDHFKTLAEKNDIPLQFEIGTFGTTDASQISISRGGVPSTSINVPIRNLHTSFGIVNLKDINYTVKLLKLLLKSKLPNIGIDKKEEGIIKGVKKKPLKKKKG